MAINSTIKSSRLLQSKRYTQTQLADSQEAFTRVFDLNASEIYAQQDLIPTSSLPYSGSSQNELTNGVIKFYYRQRLTPSDTLDSSNYSTFFFINPTSSIDFTNGINPGVLNTNQQGNFISPKYAPTLANNTENITPGYQVTLTDSGGTLINPTLYTFDYKTGVLQYSASSGFATIPSAEVYLTAYQYIGSTLASLSTSLTASYAFTASYAMNGGGTGTPSGNDGDFQYKNGSNFAGSSNLTQSGSLLVLSGSLVSKAAPTVPVIDATPSTNVALYATNETASFPNFSGMIIFTNWSNSATTLAMCGGNQVNVQAFAGSFGNFGAWSYSSGTSAYVWTNTTGVNVSASFTAIKTKNSV